MNDHISDLYKIIDEFNDLRDEFNDKAHVLSLKWARKVAQMEVERDAHSSKEERLGFMDKETMDAANSLAEINRRFNQ